MDGQQFDAMTEALATSSRRRALKGLAGGALGLLLARFGADPAFAGRDRRR